MFDINRHQIQHIGLQTGKVLTLLQIVLKEIPRRLMIAFVRSNALSIDGNARHS